MLSESSLVGLVGACVSASVGYHTSSPRRSVGRPLAPIQSRGNNHLIPTPLQTGGSIVVSPLTAQGNIFDRVLACGLFGSSPIADLAILQSEIKFLQ